MRQIIFSPLDTLFFRDGKPFDQTDEGLARASMIFPPPPTATAGALSALMNKSINDENFSAPYLLTQPIGQTGPAKPYFPMPHNLFKKWNTNVPSTCEIVSLFPSEQKGRMQNNLVDRDLVSSQDIQPGENLEPVGGYFSLDDFETMLGENGDFCTLGWDPFEPAPDEDTRVGIGIDPKSGRPKDGQLYLTSHKRLEKNVRIGVDYHGEWPQDFPQSGILPLGGEGRPVHYEVGDRDGGSEGLADRFENMQPNNWHKSRKMISLVALSPVVISPEHPHGLYLDEQLFGVDVKCVAIASTRHVNIGYWNTIRDGSGEFGRPKIIRCHPAGTVFFLELSAIPDKKNFTPKSVQKYLINTRLGADKSLCAMGFGMALLYRNWV